MMRKCLAVFSVAIWMLFSLSPFAEGTDGEMAVKAMDAILEELNALNPDDYEECEASGDQLPDNGTCVSEKTLSEKEFSGSPLTKDGMHRDDGRGPLDHRVNESLSLEMGFDQLYGYDLNGSSSPYKESDAAVDVNTYIASVKYIPDFGFDSIKPYLISGFGVMSTLRTGDDGGLSKWIPGLRGEFDIGPSGRIGLGMDVQSGNTTFEIQSSYASGLGQMADIVYQSMSAKVTFHW